MLVETPQVGSEFIHTEMFEKLLECIHKNPMQPAIVYGIHTQSEARLAPTGNLNYDNFLECFVKLDPETLVKYMNEGKVKICFESKFKVTNVIHKYFQNIYTLEIVLDVILS